jgi:hypothetical protein
MPTRHLDRHPGNQDAGTNEELLANGIAHSERDLVQTTHVTHRRDPMHQFLKSMQQGTHGGFLARLS